MQFIQRHGTWMIGLVLLFAIVWYFFGRSQHTPPATTVAEIGTVTSYVSVSGNTQVEDIIPLSFPRGGTVSGVFVSRGDEVATGTILATVGDTALQTEYAAALAEVTRVRAVRNELLNGQTREESAVTSTTIKNAEDALTHTIRTEAAKVEAARTTLFSTGLTAIAKNPDTEAPVPVVSGSYTCTAEGAYTIEPYNSGTISGYSYRYSGIETGIQNASVNQSAPLGDCGLRLQFTAEESYSNTIFTLTIPNPASASYSTNYALYEQALTQEKVNIAAAQRALALALDQATISTAGARVERLIAANAVVAAAEARLAQTSYALSESAIRAPQGGVITDVNTVVGQTVATAPVVTLFAPNKTTVTARIPEKDITRLALNQTAVIEFDAKPAEIQNGTIVFLSPLQTIVNGTPYYEAVITLTEPPSWLRSGMQADIRIIVEELVDVVRIPRLFLHNEVVKVKRGEAFIATKPDILLVGTDGFVAVRGINAGDVLQLE